MRGVISVKTAIFLLIAPMAAYILYMVYTYNPATTNIFPKCPFPVYLGVYCPGCGSTRAMHQILHGNIGAAFRLNPLMVLSIPFVIYMFFAQLLALGSAMRLPALFTSDRRVKVVLLIIILYTIFRNIPLCPFTLLVPRI